MRIILYTGKGGVGKTSVAAATALRLANSGHKTLVMSTDPAHSLSDSFDVPLAAQPVSVAPNLTGQEVDVLHELENHWGTIQNWVATLLAWRGLDEIVADEMAVLPGMEELASLLHVVRHCESGDYDAIIVDCAPTGETLRLLSFPEVARWWMTHIFPWSHRAMALVRPLVKPLMDLPLPDDQVFRSAEDLFQELVKMRTYLSDPEVTSVRLVVNPERMVIKETQRTFTYLNLYGYATDLVICNRVLPEGLKDSFFDGWREAQGRHLQTIMESFSPVPVLRAPLFPREVIGLEMLKQVGDAIFGDGDPARIYFRGQAQEVHKEDGHFQLTLPLPFVTREELSVAQNGDELVVQAGRQRRNIFLPRTLAGLPVLDAKFEGDLLRIRFQDKERAGRKVRRGTQE